MNLVPRLVCRELSRKYQLTPVDRIPGFIKLGIGFCKVWMAIYKSCHVISHFKVCGNE